MQAISMHENVAKQLHLPAQSGSSSMLQRMRRGHTREAYDLLVQSVRQTIPGIALSTDLISGEPYPAGCRARALAVPACGVQPC